MDAFSFRDTTTFPDVRTFMEGYRTLGRYRAVLEDPAIAPEQRHRLASRVGALAAATLEREGVLRSEGLMGALVCREPLA